MRLLTNSEKSYNNLLSRVSELDYYIQTSSEIRDENYFNMLILKALVKHEEKAMEEYQKIKEIKAMTKEERKKLLEYEENGELRIQKYGLSEYSKIYVLSKFLGVKELLRVERNDSDRFIKLRKYGVPEEEILKIICDEKNKYLQELLLESKLEDSRGKEVPVANLIFKDEENVKKLLFLSDTCSIDVIKNIIKGRYGDLKGDEADLIILNSAKEGIESILKDTRLFTRQKRTTRRSIKKICNNKELN